MPGCSRWHAKFSKQEQLEASNSDEHKGWPTSHTMLKEEWVPACIMIKIWESSLLVVGWCQLFLRLSMETYPRLYTILGHPRKPQLELQIVAWCQCTQKEIMVVDWPSDQGTVRQAYAAASEMAVAVSWACPQAQPPHDHTPSSLCHENRPQHRLPMLHTVCTPCPHKQAGWMVGEKWPLRDWVRTWLPHILCTLPCTQLYIHNRSK